MANKAKTALLCAYTLARAKQYAEAEALLLSHEEVSKTPEALDLLARMRMEEGDVAEARRLWQAIVTVEPHFQPAIDALKVIDRKRICLPWKRLLSGLIVVALAVGFYLGTEVGREPQAKDAVATVIWERIPTQAMLDALAPYKGKTVRVCLASRFFADPDRVAQRAVLTELLAEALDLPVTAVYIGEASAQSAEEEITVELL